MSMTTVINDSIERKLLDLNVAYIAIVLETNGERAKIQPLGMIKQVGENAKPKAPIPDVPIIKAARYKLVEKEITYISAIDTSKSNVISSVNAPTKSVTSDVTTTRKTVDKVGATKATVNFISDVTLTGEYNPNDGGTSDYQLNKTTSSVEYVSGLTYEGQSVVDTVKAEKTDVISSISTGNSNVISAVTPTFKKQIVLEKRAIAKNDLVFVVCADRNITESLKGINATPPIGHHSLSDSIIVGIL